MKKEDTLWLTNHAAFLLRLEMYDLLITSGKNGRGNDSRMNRYWAVKKAEEWSLKKQNLQVNLEYCSE